LNGWDRQAEKALNVGIETALVLSVLLFADKQIEVQQVDTMTLDGVYLLILYACDSCKVAIAVVDIVTKLGTDENHSENQSKSRIFQNRRLTCG
jgi:hypothetical protein